MSGGRLLTTKAWPLQAKGKRTKTKKYGSSDDENSAEPTKVKPKSMGVKAFTKRKTNANGKKWEIFKEV